MGTRLTMRRLRAMEAALSAMLAGEQGEGDWPEEIPVEDAAAAHDWVCEQLDKREQRK
jgi:hypothetical protein